MATFNSSQRRKGSSLGRWAALAVLIHLQLLLIAGSCCISGPRAMPEIVAAQKRVAAQGSAEPIA